MFESNHKWIDFDLYLYFNIRPNIPGVYNDPNVNVRDMKYIIEYFLCSIREQ